MVIAIIGSGRQGTAAAYDMIRSDDVDRLLLIDNSDTSLKKSKEHLLKLVPNIEIKLEKVDIDNDRSLLLDLLEDVFLFISAVPYKYNYFLTMVALDSKTSMVDLGGNTEIVRKQLSMTDRAKDKGITIVPDCGMGPGMNISMAMLAMEMTDIPKNVSIWDGGLPKNPKPPWNYNLFFNINGLTNEYDESAYFIDNGKVVEVPCFERYEIIDFGLPFGKLEAAVTSGGLSTLPWTMEGKLDSLENKTLRYLGHWEWMKAYRELGLFNEAAIKFKGVDIIPRELYHDLISKKLDNGNKDDICIMRIKCEGIKDNKAVEVLIDAIETYDNDTCFMAMEKWTGWHASIIAQRIISGDIDKGAISVENSISGHDFYKEAIKRGYKIETQIKDK